jgi:hypothetical protein
MNVFNSQFEDRRTSAPRRLKEAVLRSFLGSAGEAANQFQSYSLIEWQAILVWLDISGMALYLLDRVRELEIEDSVPVPIRERLLLSLERNRERTTSLLNHAKSVASRFKHGGISFALLKGITLTPDSVPDPALRWQTDLDFLVSETDAKAASEILQSFGYTLHASSGHTMEFRSGSSGKWDLANLYRAGIQRSLELHCLPRCEGSSDRLTRASSRLFDGTEIPALSAADTLVQQALHLMKHLCGEHTRLSWVLEFTRHFRMRQHDHAFWNDVRAIAAAEPQAGLAMAMSLWLAAELFGVNLPSAVDPWTPDQIPDGVLLWLHRYARELLLSDSHASKLYLLLRRQLPNRPNVKGTARLMIPLCLPARITEPVPGETLADRLTRYQIEAGYSWQRLRFHLFEGLRLGIEALYWEWRMPKVQQR